MYYGSVGFIKLDAHCCKQYLGPEIFGFLFPEHFLSNNTAYIGILS